MNYALVTGASRGIGRAIAVHLARLGYPILVNYASNNTAAEETAALIRAEKQDVELLKFDVSDPEAIENAMSIWEENHPDDKILILVNNAGIRDDAMMFSMSNSQWHSVLDTTLNGFFYLTRRLLKNMLTSRFGRIINVVSLSGIKGLPGQTNYSAAKAAIIGATKALAQEVAIRKVTVNAIAPGFIETDMTKDLDIENLKKTIPARRFGTPDEVAELAAFLASDKAAYINGETISINGALYT